jgi:uncharacterized protein
MVVGVLAIDLYFPDCQSLKEKRRVLQRLKEGGRRQFNVSVAELRDHQEMWQRSSMGIAGVGADRRYVNGQLSYVIDWIERQRQLEVTNYQLEWR